MYGFGTADYLSSNNSVEQFLNTFRSPQIPGEGSTPIQLIDSVSVKMLVLCLYFFFTIK